MIANLKKLKLDAAARIAAGDYSRRAFFLRADEAGLPETKKRRRAYKRAMAFLRASRALRAQE